MTWTLRKKILLGYGITLLLLVLVVGWAFANLFRLGRATDAILSENYRSILAAENMIDAIERQDSGILLYILGFEDEGIAQFRENQSKFSQWLARAQDNITIEGEAEIVEAIDSSYDDYLIEFTQLLRADTSAPLADRYHAVLLPAFMAVRTASTDLRDLNERTMVLASNRAGNVAVSAMWSIGLLGGVALVFGGLFGWVLSNRLVRPIRHMQTATQQIAAGDYEVEVPPGPSDELGELARSFNEMAARLQAYRALNVEQLQAEKRKGEAVIQSIDDGLVLIDEQLRVQTLNPAAEEALDVRHGEARGAHVLEMIRSDTLLRYIKETFASGEAPAVEDGEHGVLSTERNGHLRHYQFVITPVYGPERQMLGVVLLLRDVTQFKELDRLKSEFVATASHELKTPLTSIGMSIGLLQERAQQQLGAREQELLEVASEDVERLRALVNDLLDLSKIEAGKIELVFDPTPVRMLFEKAVQSFGNQAEEKGVTLGYEVPEDLPAVRADANKVTWVLTNLISNALRYTDRGGHIMLSAEHVGSKVHLSVADDGEGIPYAYQTKIFDKFVQVEGERSVGGTGLGLAICQEIVRAHGGSIWVDSTPGEGSTFTFTLPLAQRDGQFERST